MPAVSPGLSSRERACVEQVLSRARIAYVAMVETPGAEAAPQANAPQSCDRPPSVPQPYVTPMNFAYEPAAGSDDERIERNGCGDATTGPEGRLLLHTGPGRKVEALQQNPRVCISVTSEERLKLGATPCQDGYLYQSVIVEGRATVLADESEREAALRAIVAKYDPQAIDRRFDEQIFAQTLLYAVRIEVIGFKERPKLAQED